MGKIKVTTEGHIMSVDEVRASAIKALRRVGKRFDLVGEKSRGSAEGGNPHWRSSLLVRQALERIDGAEEK